MAKLQELANASAAAQEPGFTKPGKARLGGVDPLGLRQINFDLMDEVLPGVNNVARHIRPFVVLAWAWRRALQRARVLGRERIRQGDLRDFVDRIDALYALSQFLRDPGTDLPGSQYLEPWRREGQIDFGGTKWRRRCEERRDSTALSAPVNYGPGLRMLGWVRPHPEYRNVMIANEAVSPALDALETEIGTALDHEAFNDFGSVTVAVDDARLWGSLWALEDVTDAEKHVMAEQLGGDGAPAGRKLSIELMNDAARRVGTLAVEGVRAAMTGPPSEYEPPERLLDVRYKWRLLQVRQLFRLSLETFFFWTMRKLESQERSIEALVEEFLSRVGGRSAAASGSAGGWIESLISPAEGPTELMEGIERALGGATVDDLPHSVARGLARALSEETPDLNQRHERLPLWRARREREAWSDSPVGDFVRHVLESWVLAQHTYWSVGRGLADARAGGRLLLRLRVILEEGGWTLTPGAQTIGRPRPTPDRLGTAITLACECGLIGG